MKSVLRTSMLTLTLAALCAAAPSNCTPAAALPATVAHHTQSDDSYRQSEAPHPKSASFSLGSVPMTVITDKGHVYKGVLNVAIPASFQLSDGRVECSGEFPSFIAGNSKVYTIPFVCDRGSKGIAIFTDIYNVSNGGGGFVRFSDGTAGTFITGSAAADF